MTQQDASNSSAIHGSNGVHECNNDRYVVCVSWSVIFEDMSVYQQTPGTFIKPIISNQGADIHSNVSKVAITMAHELLEAFTQKSNGTKINCYNKASLMLHGVECFVEYSVTAKDSSAPNALSPLHQLEDTIHKLDRHLKTALFNAIDPQYVTMRGSERGECYGEYYPADLETW